MMSLMPSYRPTRKSYDLIDNYHQTTLGFGTIQRKLPKISLILFNLLLLLSTTNSSPLLGDTADRLATESSSSSIAIEQDNSVTTTTVSLVNSPDASNVSATTTAIPISLQSEATTRVPNEDIFTSASSTIDDATEDLTETSTQLFDTSNGSTNSPQDISDSQASLTTVSNMKISSETTTHHFVESISTVPTDSSILSNPTTIATATSPSSFEPPASINEGSTTTEKFVLPLETGSTPNSTLQEQSSGHISPIVTQSTSISTEDSKARVDANEITNPHQADPSSGLTVVSSEPLVISTTKIDAITSPTTASSVTTPISITTQDILPTTQVTTLSPVVITATTILSNTVSTPQMVNSNRSSRVHEPSPDSSIQTTTATVTTLARVEESLTTTTKPIVQLLISSLKFTLTAGKYWRFSISASTLQNIASKDLLRLYKNDSIGLVSVDEDNDWITYNHMSSQLSAWPAWSKDIGSHDFVLAIPDRGEGLPRPEVIIKVTVVDQELPLILNHEYSLPRIKRQKSQYSSSLNQSIYTLSKIVASDNSTSPKLVNSRLSDILLRECAFSTSEETSELAITWSNITITQQKDCPIEMLQMSLRKMGDINSLKRLNNSSYTITLNPQARQSLDDNLHLELHLLGPCKSLSIVPEFSTVSPYVSSTDSKISNLLTSTSVTATDEPIVNEEPPITRVKIQPTMADPPTINNSPANVSIGDGERNLYFQPTNVTVTPIFTSVLDPKSNNIDSTNVSTSANILDILSGTDEYLGPIALPVIIVVGILLFICAIVSYIVTCIKRKNSQKFRVRNRFDFRYESERRAFLKKGSKPVILDSDQRNISIGGTPQHHAKAMGDTINNPTRLGSINTPINDSELSTPLRNLGPPTIDERNQDADNSIVTSDLCKTSFSNNRYS